MTTWRRLTGVALVACLGLLLGLMASRADEKDKEGDKTGTNFDKVIGAKAKVTAAAEAIANRALATQLVEFGRKNKSPEALITAAEILGKLPASAEDKQEPKADKIPGASEDKTAQPGEAKKVKLEPQALLEEAKKLSDGDPHIVALAERVAKTLEERPRGVTPAPVHQAHTVVPGYRDSWKFTYRGGERAAVLVTGNGAADVTLDVYDENGNYIAGYTGQAPYAAWTPKWTGPFTIQVSNSGGSAVYYTIDTN